MTSWGFQSNSLDLRRFLPLLHSQATWNEILTGEKSSRPRYFQHGFKLKPVWRLWTGRVFWKVGRQLAVLSPLMHKERETLPAMSILHLSPLGPKFYP